VPVKLHTAVKEERIQFHLLHRPDHVKLQQQMICAHEMVPVPAEEQTRGFELEEGKYLLIDPAELEQTEPEESRTIEVHEFVKTGQIDPVFLERTYYLEPDVHEKGYNTLAGAMAERVKKVFINWSQNDASKTMVCVYSLRAREKPFVSFPLLWKELEELAGRGDPEKLLVLASDAQIRAEKEGDPFREVLVKKQKLPYL
jgi:Ku protein